jgi:hypothetical protein
MNIFAIEGDVETGEIDWVKSAQSQDNLRVVKMILESCQILSTVLNEQGLDAPYRSFNPKHPSCLWAAESASNYMNLALHCQAMIDEYEHRFNKTHKCQAVLKTLIDMFDPDLFPTTECTPLRLAMPDEFRPKHQVSGSDVKVTHSSHRAVEAYRAYYHSKQFAKWEKGTPAPDWWRGVEVTA